MNSVCDTVPVSATNATGPVLRMPLPPMPIENESTSR